MAKPTPGQFVREVRQEISKVTWASRRDTLVALVSVFVFCIFFGIYFLIVDRILSAGMSLLFG